MIAGTFPRNWSFMHRAVTGLMGALSALHENEMAHRDLKLDNVLLYCPCVTKSLDCTCLREKSRHVHTKLADFGMSKRGSMMGISSANVRGTMMYIPPERVHYNQKKHHKNFYALTDIYALGMLIWEVLYYVHYGKSITCMEGIMPGCKESQDVLICISSGKFVPPCDFLPEKVRKFLGSCWHLKPERRFQSVALLLERWEKMLTPLLTVSSHAAFDGETSSIGSMTGIELLHAGASTDLSSISVSVSPASTVISTG